MSLRKAPADVKVVYHLSLDGEAHGKGQVWDFVKTLWFGNRGLPRSEKEYIVDTTPFPNWSPWEKAASVACSPKRMGVIINAGFYHYYLLGLDCSGPVT